MKNISAKTVFVVGVLCGLCFALGYGMQLLKPEFAVVKTEGVSVIQTEAMDQARKKFESLAQVEYQDYLNLKSAEEKYKKADEILGKVFQIFLADLGIHVVRRTETVAAASQTPGLSSEQAPGSTITALPVGAPDVTGKAAAHPYIGGSLTVTLSGLNDEAQTTAFLKANEIEDFTQIIFDSKPMPKPPKTLVGCYEGDIEFNDGKTWQMKMSHAFEDSGAASSGTYFITMFAQGQKDSRTRGNGVMKDVRGIPSSPDSLLIQASPTDNFQLFYLPQSESFIGNIYQKQKDEKFVPKGKVTLHRGSNCGG